MTSGRSHVVDCGDDGRIEFIHTAQRPDQLAGELTYDAERHRWCAPARQPTPDMEVVRELFWSDGGWYQVSPRGLCRAGASSPTARRFRVQILPCIMKWVFVWPGCCPVHGPRSGDLPLAMSAVLPFRIAIAHAGTMRKSSRACHWRSMSRAVRRPHLLATRIRPTPYG